MSPVHSRSRHGVFKRAAGLWVLMFLVCFGLGYPTLNRYDARSDFDASQYYAMTEESWVAAEGHWRYRVMVPYLAKPVYRLAEGRVGTWNPVFFGLLVVNSMFVAATVVLLFFVAGRCGVDPGVALVACLLYLANFAVPNLQLAARIDSAEAFWLMLLVVALAAGRWHWLPLLAIPAAFAKETFVPLATCFAGVWWIVQAQRRTLGFGPLGWVVAMAVVGLGTVCALRSAFEGGVVWPWAIVTGVASTTSLSGGLAGIFADRYFWYIWIWLLPLGLLRLTRLPAEWVTASLASAGLAVLLGAFADSHGNVARALFDVAGPMFSLSAALALGEFLGASSRPAAPLGN